MGRYLRGGLLLWVVACTEPAWAPPDPLPVTLLTPEVWSGGEALLVSAAFTPDRGLPTVLLNADTLAVRRLDDTTVAAQLPDLPGTQSLHVLAPDVLDFPIAIELRGFEGAGQGPLVSGRLQVLPGWPPTVVGSGVTAGVLWNLQSAITTPLPDSLHDPTCFRARGVGPSYADGGVALESPCGRWWSWRLRPVAELIADSLCGEGFFVAELAPRRVLSIGSTDVSVSDPGIAGCSRSPLATVPAVYDVVISPRRDRAVIIGFTYTLVPGVPVVDVASGEIAYYLPRLVEDPTAAFSAEGETLFVAGDDAAGEQLLLALRAADGHVLHSVSLPRGAAWAIAPDPSRPWLYVVGTTSPGYAGRLLVYDRDSLGLLATVGIPDSVSGLDCCDVNSRILPSPADQLVYVVTTLEFYEPAAHAFLTRFRTPP